MERFLTVVSKREQLSRAFDSSRSHSSSSNGGSPVEPLHLRARRSITTRVDKYAGYAASALILERRCDSESLTQTVLRVLNKERHFMCVYAFGTNWRCAVGYTKRYSRLKLAQSSTYRIALAHALLHCEGLEVPRNTVEYEWLAGDDEEFLEHVYEHTLWCVQHGTTLENSSRCGAYEYVSAKITEALEEHHSNVRYERCKHYYALCAQLENGLPPVSSVRNTLGSERAELYEYACTACENDERQYALDIDDVLQCGTSCAWNKSMIERRLELFAVYYETLHMDEEESSEYVARWRAQRAERRNERGERKRQRAAELNVWKIRRNEAEQWCAALGAELWNEYERCSTILQDRLPRGVYQYVPRRHFSTTALDSMRAENLEAMQRAAHNVQNH